ncbi:MAG: AAA family ATPase, partial [Oligoflexales bacterium]|nr:AAA family ATPase [Oligoflexales bacterium]
MNALPTCRVADIGETAEKLKWMIEGLWLDNAVGLIGGEPKSYKTFAALSLAVAVASGKNCFGHYQVKRCGSVLLYAAEDSLIMVKERIQGICKGMEAPFDTLDVHVITAPRLRIDSQIDRKKMEDLVQNIKPVLLVLDPFVRLHSIDENSSGEVARVLSWLRDLQRQYNLNIVMVHHARKRAGNERPGQSLRGSSELHAWGDSNLYLRRMANEDSYVEFTIEHRAAPSQGNIQLRFNSGDSPPFLSYEGGGQSAQVSPPSPRERILNTLTSLGPQIPGESLRSACGMKSSTFWQTLNQLLQSNLIIKNDDNTYTSL